MIGTRERWIAMIGCFAAGAVVFGAKASGPVLAIWLATVLVGVSAWRPNGRNIAAEFATPPAPAAMLLLIALYAMMSSVWAHNPRAAIDAGGTLGAAIAAGHLLDRALRRLPPDAATLVSGWFVIGLVGGGLLLLFEFLSNFALLQWLLTSFPRLKPDQNMMMANAGEHQLVVYREVGNWSVAFVSFILWPSILAVSAIIRSPARWLGLAALFGLSAAITLISDHQTSQVALFASAAIFGAALYAPEALRKAALAGSIALILVMVPLCYGVNRVANLQDASWAQFSLKERFRIWSNVAEHYLQAPVFGIGANNTTIVETYGAPPPPSKQQAIPKHHPHNMILQIWLELGAVGAALLGLACLSVFRTLKSVAPHSLPYVLATGATVAIQASATWSLWSTWFLSALALTVSFLFLGVRVAHDARHSQAQTFAQVWMPKVLTAKLRA